MVWYGKLKFRKREKVWFGRPKLRKRKKVWFGRQLGVKFGP